MNLKYLNLVQDRWCKYYYQQNSSKPLTSVQRSKIKYKSEGILIDFFSEAYEEIKTAEAFYIKKRKEYIFEFIEL